MDKIKNKSKKVKEKINHRICRIEYLNSGEKFEFINLPNDFRNLFIKRVSSCAAYFGGEIKVISWDDDGNKVETWQKVQPNAAASTSCLVKIL